MSKEKRALENLEESEEEEYYMDSPISEDADSEDSSEVDMVNVDFEFFDLKEIDFHAIKRLLIQYFGDDNTLFDLGELADLIVKQKYVGSTVKVEKEEDPYAFFTVLNLTEYKEKQCIKQIVNYLVGKSESNKNAHLKLVDLVVDQNNGKLPEVGLLLHERLPNMPPQIVPPMMKMLFEEIQWAIEDKERYEFEWYILVSPTFKEISPNKSKSSGSATDPSGKKKHAKSFDHISYLHQEDEFIAPFADFSFDFKLSNSTRPTGTLNAFGEYSLNFRRRCFVFHKDKLPLIYDKLETLFRA
ncbi:hypothetical protein BB560_005460 [Smittium megazygosporum]|uniref:Protein BCP1 n=1 Tax=Smittium megazygosporum TaxID=133381 RepID=A0A2T9Z571_9FUNG|nr:hypothetical protein BB560_005460 [Smittium megazygosporum]